MYTEERYPGCVTFADYKELFNCKNIDLVVNTSYSEMHTPIAEGCNCVTHLYSCTSTVTREFGFRHLGIIETAYLRPDMDVEIIADGKHLPPRS